jgi:hypothetical protein
VVAAMSTMPVAASDRHACGPISDTYDLPMPSPGLVAVADLVVDANCEVQAGPVSFVAPMELAPSPSDMTKATFGSLAGSAAATDAATNGSASGCCWAAYAVQRSWDCCGIEMNEYWTEFGWSNCSGGLCSPYIRSYSGRDGGKWATELLTCGPGWSRVSSDHYLYISSGGVGYTWVTLKGHQGYSYKGRFDCGGNDYYNSYTNYVTGYSNGNWYCSYSYSWKKSFVGWHTQSWCGSGAYPYK